MQKDIEYNAIVIYTISDEIRDQIREMISSNFGGIFVNESAYAVPFDSIKSICETVVELLNSKHYKLKKDEFVRYLVSASKLNMKSDKIIQRSIKEPEKS